MRIIFRDARDRLVRSIFAVSFSAEFSEHGAFVVEIVDFEGDSWYCQSMSFDQFDEYAYYLALDGFIDLRGFLFSMDVVES